MFRQQSDPNPGDSRNKVYVFKQDTSGKLLYFVHSQPGVTNPIFKFVLNNQSVITATNVPSTAGGLTATTFDVNSSVNGVFEPFSFVSADPWISFISIDNRPSPLEKGITFNVLANSGVERTGHVVFKMDNYNIYVVCVLVQNGV